MKSWETLTSLAMLKVNIDQGQDYLDYLRPFVLQVLADSRLDRVTDQGVHKLIRDKFGLVIPARTVQLVLKRLARAKLLKRQDHVYQIVGGLPNPGIEQKKSEAERHIQAVINGLLDFAKSRSQVIATPEQAVTAITGFLSEFNVSFLRAYLRGTAIPVVPGKLQTHIVLVSEYVLHLQRTDPERFESLLVMVQGHMLANALLCPDLQNAPKSYSGVTFFLDTPLLVQLVGLEGEPKKRAMEELIALVRNLGGTVATFSHSREEFERVLKSAAEHLNAPDGRGAVISEARRKETTKSDLLLLAGQIHALLENAQIEVRSTPRYIEEFQIDEATFGQILEDEVYYFNPRAREYDINSVRSIYVLRSNTTPDSVERSKAVLVTSNTAFARAAYDYGRQHEESREVSSVITDFSLANMAWLKAPMGAPSIPMTEVLAYSYAALQPSAELLARFMAEIDKLQQNHKISERDHQLLRSSALAQDELMRLTLGDEAALTEQTVTETLRRVTNEIKREETDKANREQESHRVTLKQLETTRAQRDSLQKRIYWKSKRKSRLIARIVSIAVSMLLVLGIVAGLGIKTHNPIMGWLLFSGSLFLAIATLMNALFGTTVVQVYEAIETRYLAYFLRRESKATGIDLTVAR